MSAAKCDVSFKIEYESSSPITEATVAYLDPQGPTHDIKQYLTTGIVKLSEIQDDIQIPDTYKMEVKLVANGIVTTREFSLTVDGCSTSSSCYVPKIYDVNVLNDGRIVMNYWVDNTSDVATLEYQIAKDSGFTDIIYSKVGFSDTAYTLFEYIDMKNGNIPDYTLLFIRIRKYCSSPSGISDWSNIFDFRSLKWPGIINSYCLSGNYDMDKVICETKDEYKREVVLDTFEPKIGSLIYLKDGITPAVIGNLSDFDGDPSLEFNRHGIRWIRFPDFDKNVVFDVDPQTGKIEKISDLVCII
ncbi:hypothetical protein [Chryseobacterium sp.]|uniref:hypothetical protein n=1 Tax=Chryseobacterium sp. TaxID=1871047 RepID=UPI0028A2CB5C|nr:hypothetical protein [Chryseobacterium sp.]